MATVATASVGPRYAPDDPTLPKPWRGLIDGDSGYLYYWNPETNVTQYDKPGASSNGGSAPSKSSAVHISSSIHVQQASAMQNRESRHDEDGDEKYSRFNGGRIHQNGGSANLHPLNVSNGSAGARLPGVSVALDAGSALSADAYSRRHEITVTGGNVPSPFTSFEATGFPSEILREVRYLLQGGANVVHCVVLPSVWGLEF